LIAQFPIDLKNSNCIAEGLSPDGKWLATRCGYGDNKTLVLRSKPGKRWVLKFRDFLRQDISEERTSTLRPLFWSANGLYLYFAPGLEREGDSNPCSPRPGNEYGLFRLNLNWGTWVALIPPAVSFPGYDIEFSLTGQQYATDADGVRITDVKTGEVTQLNVDGTVMDLLWSPDGLHLAYSVARCDEQIVKSSWVYVWDPTTKQPELVRVSHEGILFRAESWTSNATLRILGEKQVAPKTVDIIYVYDIAGGYLMFSGTVTPSR
jgi:WD40 repeat protein